MCLVGHSQGGTLPLMLLSERPEYHEKIWLLALMGPVVGPEDVRAKLLRKQADTNSASVRAGGLGAVGG